MQRTSIKVVPSGVDSTLKSSVVFRLQQESKLANRQAKLDDLVSKFPSFKGFTSEVISSCYKEVYKLCQLYELLPQTCCLFDVIFRNYLGLKVTALLKKHQAILVSNQGICHTMVRQIEALKVDALLSLRLAMKHCEK